MFGELISTGITFGAGRILINDAFSATANFNTITAVTISAATIYSGSTDIGTLISGGGGTSGNLWSASTGSNSIIANNGTGNVASGAFSFAGGNYNQAHGNFSFVGAGQANSATTNYTTTVGGFLFFLYGIYSVVV